MKRIIFLILAVLILQNLVLAADSLHVEKIVDKQDIKVGDNVTILLKFTNPFGKEIPVRIVDKNIFGNNGLDIQCLEYLLPAQKETALAYEPAIKPFKAGEYTLNSAEITYTNPETGKEETIKSNTLKVSVKDSGVQQGQVQGITSIYRCNGINMQSTSYSSSGGSFTMQIGNSNIQQPSRQTNKQNDIQNKVQNNQLNQNTNSIKQQMERQMQEQRQMRENFQKNVENTSEFQRKHQELLNLGYQLKNSSFNPSSNNTGTFRYNYQKPNGETATLKGEMENGTMKNLMSLTQEEKNKILNALRQNKQFQELNKKLNQRGFNQSGVKFDQVSANHTKIEINYQNKLGEAKKITADYINQKIENITLEEEKEKRDNWWFLLLIPVLIGLIWIYKKYFKKSEITEIAPEMKIEEPIDYRKEAKKMIAKAEKLFKNKKEKDAYEKVSQAIRYYFSNKLKIKKEITNTELLKILEIKKFRNYKEIKSCLDLCTLVEFAKYKANKKDFEKIISIAKKVIV